MAEPWLSVVMPVHDGAHHLPATLASVAACQPDGVEFLLYDSSEDTACADIAATYSDRLTLRYVAMPEVRGWPEKTNLAVANAKARHIAMLHQDDIWLTGHIDAVRRAIAQHPDAAMSIAASRLIDVNGRDLGRWSLPLPHGLSTGHDFGRRLIVQNFLAIPSPIIRRDAWLALGGLDPSLWYTADWDLYLKLARTGDIAIRPETTTAFRIHGNSLTMTGSRTPGAMQEQLEAVLQRHGIWFGVEQDRGLQARARASAAINCCLAKGAAGESRWLLPMLSSLLGLGPVNGLRYIHESRLADRVLPRLRARCAGAL
jgi:hypothetical protein